VPASGLAGHGDRVIVVGGTDGLTGLKTCEFLQFPALPGGATAPMVQWRWVQGPEMRLARAAPALAVLPARADLPPGAVDYAAVKKAKVAEVRRARRAEQDQW